MNHSRISVSFLVTLFLCGSLFSVEALAKPNKTPPCKGADFFVYMEANKPDTFASITELVQAKTPNANAVFWRIESKGVVEPS